MKKRAALGMAAFGFGQVVQIAGQLLTVPVLATHWGLAVYGQWLMLSAVPMFLASGDLGFGWSAGNRIVAEVAVGQREEASITLQSALAMILGSSLLMLAIALTITWLLPDTIFHVQGGVDEHSARIILSLLLAYGWTGVILGIQAMCARSEHKFAPYTARSATMIAIEFGIVICVAALGGSPTLTAISLAGTRFVSVALLSVQVCRWAPWIRLGFGKAEWTRIRQMAGPAFPTMVMPLALASYLQGSALVVGAAGGASLVPVFTTLRTLSRVGLQGLNAIILPLTSEYTAALAQANLDRASKIKGASMLAALGIGIGYAAGLIIVGRIVVTRWTHGTIVPSEALMLATAVGVPFSLLWNSVSNLLLAQNRQGEFAYKFLFGAIVSLIAGYPLVERLGVIGILWSGVAFEIFMCVTLLKAQRITLADMVASVRSLRGAWQIGRQRIASRPK